MTRRSNEESSINLSASGHLWKEEELMRKTVFAMYDGQSLKTEETLDLPIDSRIKLIIAAEENEPDNGKQRTPQIEQTELENAGVILPQHPNGLIRLLRSWREEENGEEQRETWEYLKHALDEDRLSYRRLFA